MNDYKIPKKLPFSSKTLRTKVVLSYIIDYVIIIALVAGFYALDAVEPFHQRFSLRNYTLRYPFAVHERVPIPLLLGVAILAPAVIIAFYTLVFDGLFSHQAGGRRKKYPLKSRLWELNCGVLGLLLGVGAAFVITGALKNAIGKPRPDLIDRCKPRVEDMNAFLVPGNYSLVGHDICTQTDNAILKDGFRSFPSGHSSSAFGGLFYLSLYLAGKMHALDSRGEVWKTFIILIPTLGAALVAGSRIMDARHHPFDVITGSMLGILTAWAAYRQFFPPLSDFRAKGRAYPIRTWGRISEDYEELDRLPLKADASGLGFGSGRDASPPSTSGNVFRDEIGASHRRRRQDAGYADPSSSAAAPSSSNYASNYSTGNPFAPSGSRRQGTRDDWEDSTDDEAGDDVELQPTSHYDPPPVRRASQDMSYSAYKPQPAPPESAAASTPIIGVGSDQGVLPLSSAPQPPPHIQPLRNVQLTDD